MKVVALVSGGKDSCFNILHCLSQGHEIVALANLKPANSEVQELDSFMFQTVGHDALTYYSECTGLPMFRGSIKGSSSNQKLEYKKTANDEIEDLYQLLSEVKTAHLDLQAVSVGAILSSYQRTRVEDACSRLGLTSLAFLWQRNQFELMQEMVGSSMDARLIKVAAIGLNESHLGKSLKEMFTTLINLDRKFGVHICGEGGEFESLVLDCPFFIKKLEITKSEIISSGNDVYYLKPIEFKIVEKVMGKDEEFHSIKEQGIDWKKFVPIRSVLNNQFQEIYEALKTRTLETTSSNNSECVFNNPPIKCVKQVKSKLFVSNLSSNKESIKSQVEDVFNQLKAILESNNIDSSHIQHSTLLISSMSNFAEINSYYVQNFTEPLPPSRVCIETHLPSSNFLQLSVVAMVDSSYKTGVHIQGRSYWAPANIGPYSQTIMDENLVASISGQIPLIPASMELASVDEFYDVVLSLQHFNSVKDIIGAVNQLSTVAFIKGVQFVDIVTSAWEKYTNLNLDGSNPIESLIVVQVTELPKGANAEWGGLAFKSLTNLYESDSEDEETALDIQFKELSIKANNDERIQNLALTKEEFSELSFNSNQHYTIYTCPENIALYNSSYSIEYVPVLNVWNYKGEVKEFGITIR